MPYGANFSHAGEDWDVALAADAATSFEGFSIFLSRGRAKVGYVLCRVERGPTLVLRGLHVAARRRGEGLATFLVHIWLGLARELGCAARSARIDKPVLCLVLAAAGLVPDKRALAVRVAREEEGGAVVWSESDARGDANDIFSKQFRGSQRLRVKARGEAAPADARTAYVRAVFSFPRGARPPPLAGAAWRPARLVAFANGLPTLRERLRTGEGWG